MPPFGFRKRERAASPESSGSTKKRKATPQEDTPSKVKPTLFDTADEATKQQASLEESRKFLEGLDQDEGDSSLSDADSGDFEDVPPPKKQKMADGKGKEDVEESDDDEMDWEDAIQAGSSEHATPGAGQQEHEIGDVSISMNEDGSYIEPLVSAATGKKGPSKRERQIRVQTHCLHVMSLMWHNTVRNSWVNDKQVQKILVDELPPGVKQEVQRFRRHLRVSEPGTVEVTKPTRPAKGKGKRPVKDDKKGGRDWNKAAQSQEPDTLQTTNALLRLLKVLTAYWRKRFTVTASGLRKQGYKDLRRLRNEIKTWEKDKTQAEIHGERIESREEFRKCATESEGSRDTGAQLFVALLRGLELDVRMVSNLQPAGFGWSKMEDAHPPKAKHKDQDVSIVESDTDAEVKVVSASKAGRSSEGGSRKNGPALKSEKPTRKSNRGGKKDPINLDDSDSPLSDAPSDFEEAEGDDDQDDDLSVIDVTPSFPKKKKPYRKFDRDLAFPLYWGEVRDPSSNKYFPVDPMVLSTIASSDELLQTFEPRGKKAEVSKQVICYVVAYAADGTAKDVTIRYLKRHQLPGKTKGVRMPVEKIPIYNRHGKVKRYEEYDWFRTVMSLYDRAEPKRTLADDLEDQTDLKAFKPNKEAKLVEKESLQGYKQSAEFVLEQHLRREEALKPGLKPVKTFTAGKGDKAVDHPVYRRSDVVACKTVESWHKEGRAIRVGEQPMKHVPVRAVTLIRKREMEDAQRETGEKLKQGLYSIDQTDWIIPPPIQNGVIPRNAFGNMDVYVPTMVPRGAVHLPLKGTAKICRKLQIDHAEACTGFEFGKQRAVPVLTGVVVAKENERLVKDAWRAERAEHKRKEDTKHTATALHWWRKMLLGLRVLERMRVEYADTGGTEEEVNPFVLKARREGRDGTVGATNFDMAGEGMGGGFLPDEDDDGHAPQDTPSARPEDATGDGGFLVEDIANNDEDAEGGFLVEDELGAHDDAALKNHVPITPVSLQSMHQMDKAAMNGQISNEAKGALKEPARSTKKPPSSRKQPQSKGESNRRKPTVIIPSSDESEDDQASSLSDLESESDSSEVTDDASKSTATTKHQSKRGSPQVVVTPVKSSAKAKGKTRASKKATPVRSPYFDHGNGSSENDEDEEVEEEVVKPRRTTARTKAKR